MTIAQPSVDDVRVIISTSKDDTAISAYITDAVLIAEGCPAIAEMSEARQQAIVKYLTAHLISTAPGAGGGGVLTQKSLGDASETYASGMLGMGLESTPFGIQALAFDTSGCLRTLGKIRASLYAL